MDEKTIQEWDELIKQPDSAFRDEFTPTQSGIVAIAYVISAVVVIGLCVWGLTRG